MTAQSQVWINLTDWQLLNHIKLNRISYLIYSLSLYMEWINLAVVLSHTIVYIHQNESETKIHPPNYRPHNKNLDDISFLAEAEMTN